MTVNFIATNTIVKNISYIDGTLKNNIGKQTLQSLGKLGNLPATVIETGVTPTLPVKSFIKVVSTGDLSGKVITIYFDNDTQINNSFELSTAFLPDTGFIRCFNSTGSSILKGRLVRTTGFNSANQVSEIAEASAAAASTAVVLGVTEEDIASGEIGSVLTNGSFQADTSSFSAINDDVFLSDTAGLFATTAGTVNVVVGKVVSLDTSGIISFFSGLTGASGSGSGGGGGGGAVIPTAVDTLTELKAIASSGLIDDQLLLVREFSGTPPTSRTFWWDSDSQSIPDDSVIIKPDDVAAQPKFAEMYIPYDNDTYPNPALFDALWATGDDRSGAFSAFQPVSSGGWIQFHNGGSAVEAWVNYDFSNNVGFNTGAIRFMYKPLYTGTPGTDQVFFTTATPGPGDGVNLIRLKHSAGSGTIDVRVIDDAGIERINASLGAWAPVSGIIYELELNWEADRDGIWLFIDGAQLGIDITIWNRTQIDATDQRNGRIGGFYTSPTSSQFEMRDFISFAAIEHPPGSSFSTPSARPPAVQQSSDPGRWRNAGT